MERTTILETLRTIVEEASSDPVDRNQITQDTTIGELGFDSLSVLDLIYDVQQAFGLDFEMQELVNINSIGELVEYLEEELKG